MLQMKVLLVVLKRLSRLAWKNFIDALAYNVKAGQNNKVWDYANALIGGTAYITGNSTQDTTLLNYIDSIATQVMRNETVTVSSGNGTQLKI